MGRKVFISFLGTQNYVETCYQFEDGNFAAPTRFVQEAILSKIAYDWINSDVIYIFCTVQAFKANWENNGHEKVREEIENTGLKERLINLNIKAKIDVVEIKEGFTNTEIWEVFQSVYSKLLVEDEIYLDITHAFRSIPIFSSTLLNYARFLKNISVKQIHYGAFEKLGPAYKVYEMQLHDRIAPVLNLINIEHLHQWTHAAQMFLETGSTRYLNNMLSEDDNTALSNFALEISEVRGLDIFCGNSADDVSIQFETLTIPNSPFEEIKNIVLNYIKSFSKNSLDNLYEAVKYCYNFNLIQQGLTILTELIISKTLFVIGFQEQEDYLNRSYRSAVSAALCIKKKEKFDFNMFEKDGVIDEKIYEIVDAIFLIPDKNKIFDFYKSLTDGGRNDINHSGFRKNAKKVGYFKEKLNEYIAKYELYFLHLNEKSVCKTIEMKGVLINLSNHPSSQWEAPQHQAASEFGEIIDIPFPEIEPEWDANQVEELAKVYLDKILAVASENHVEPVVHLMGEYIFCFKLATMLKTNDIKVLVSTSQRQSVMNDDGTKTIKFSFTRFREY